MKINTTAIIEAYNKGESLNAIARAFGTYPTTVTRILKKNGIELRHDTIKKGSFLIENGEKLIEWAKAQGRLVTKAELARVAGTKRLSPSYFIKYPELGQYVKTYNQKELVDYNKILYDWLQEHHISYKPNDRTKLGVSVTALLLGKYKGEVALQIQIKPSCVSYKNYSEKMNKTISRAKEAGIQLICIDIDDFDIGLEAIKDRLLALKK